MKALQITAISVSMALLSVGPGYAADPATTIQSGVTVAGEQVGGLTVDQAEALIASKIGAQEEAPFKIAVAGKQFALTAKDAGVDLDASATAEKALAAKAGSSVALVVTFSDKKVNAFASSVVRSVSKRRRSARAKILVTKVRYRRGRIGRTVNRRELIEKIEKRIENPGWSRDIRMPIQILQPKVTDRALRTKYRTVLTVDRHNFTLRLFKNFKVRKRYGIALGAASFSTPSGLFQISDKQVNPAWSVPNKAWAGSLAGTVVPGGAPNNPLKARWLGVGGLDGVGIHGTAEEWSIGSRASHGCIRMRVADVISLYGKVPVGTYIRISR